MDESSSNEFGNIMFRQNKMHSTFLAHMLLMNLKKLEKSNILKNAQKNLSESKFQVSKVFVEIGLTTVSLLPTALKFDKNFTQNNFLLHKAFFHFKPQKMWIERQLFQKTTKLLPIKLHIFVQILISMLLVIGQKKKFEK